MLKKGTILFFLLLNTFIYSNAQSMASRNLLDNVLPYWIFLEELRDDLAESRGIKYTAVLEQTYTFIQLELNDEDGQSFLQIRYQIKGGTKLTLYSFYCDNKDIALELENRAKKLLASFEWGTPAKNEFKLTKEQILYLEIADRIAMVGNDISTYPSFYNTFILTDDFIKLVHINDRNSRSIDHKDNYFMRDLYFFIPLKEKAIKKDTFIDSYWIGAMKVLFEDNSVKSLRETGDKIMLQIKEEIKNYK